MLTAAACTQLLPAAAWPTTTINRQRPAAAAAAASRLCSQHCAGQWQQQFTQQQQRQQQQQQRAAQRHWGPACDAAGVGSSGRHHGALPCRGLGPRCAPAGGRGGAAAAGGLLPLACSCCSAPCLGGGGVRVGDRGWGWVGGWEWGWGGGVGVSCSLEAAGARFRAGLAACHARSAARCIRPCFPAGAEGEGRLFSFSLFHDPLFMLSQQELKEKGASEEEQHAACSDGRRLRALRRRLRLSPCVSGLPGGCPRMRCRSIRGVGAPRCWGRLPGPGAQPVPADVRGPGFQGPPCLVVPWLTPLLALPARGTPTMCPDPYPPC